MKQDFRILCCDPGITNFGYSVLEVNNGVPRVVRCGMIDKRWLIDESNTQVMRPKFKRFTRMFAALVDSTSADCLVFERYIIQRRGTSGELVNQMIGAMVLTARVESTQVMAATWKARIKKLMGCKLEEFYAEVKGTKKVPDHPVDATLQGLFFCERELGVKIEKLLTKRGRKQLATAIHDGYGGAFGRNVKCK